MARDQVWTSPGKWYFLPILIRSRNEPSNCLKPVHRVYRIKKTGIVDVVVVYSTGPRGLARAGLESKGEAVVFKQGT